MKNRLILLLVIIAVTLGNAQTPPDSKGAVKAPVWTEADRQYLLNNLIRTEQSIIDETKNLTKEQWNFKESPDRWSINQIVEHLCIWELISMREISAALQQEPTPNFPYALPDSLFTEPGESKKNNALDATKPFSFAIPLGNNEGKNNVIWLTTMRNESIDYLRTETKDIRSHYICFGPNVHQNFRMIFMHSQRHLRQIKKVKAHAKYPK